MPPYGYTILSVVGADSISARLAIPITPNLLIEYISHNLQQNPLNDLTHKAYSDIMGTRFFIGRHMLCRTRKPFRIRYI